jgi:hypothetical protein
LIALNNEVKYTLWDQFDAGVFAGLTRDDEPLRKSFDGDRDALVASAMTPPFRSQMAVRRIEATNPDRTPGEVVTETKLLVVHNQFSNGDIDAVLPALL